MLSFYLVQSLFSLIWLATSTIDVSWNIGYMNQTIYSVSSGIQHLSMLTGVPGDSSSIKVVMINVAQNLTSIITTNPSTNLIKIFEAKGMNTPQQNSYIIQYKVLFTCSSLQRSNFTISNTVGTLCRTSVSYKCHGKNSTTMYEFGANSNIGGCQLRNRQMNDISIDNTTGYDAYDLSYNNDIIYTLMFQPTNLTGMAKFYNATTQLLIKTYAFTLPQAYPSMFLKVSNSYYTLAYGTTVQVFLKANSTNICNMTLTNTIFDMKITDNWVYASTSTYVRHYSIKNCMLFGETATNGSKFIEYHEPTPGIPNDRLYLWSANTTSISSSNVQNRYACPGGCTSCMSGFSIDTNKSECYYTGPSSVNATAAVNTTTNATVNVTGNTTANTTNNTTTNLTANTTTNTSTNTSINTNINTTANTTINVTANITGNVTGNTTININSSTNTNVSVPINATTNSTQSNQTLSNTSSPNPSPLPTPALPLIVIFNDSSFCYLNSFGYCQVYCDYKCFVCSPFPFQFGQCDQCAFNREKSVDGQCLITSVFIIIFTITANFAKTFRTSSTQGILFLLDNLELYIYHRTEYAGIVKGIFDQLNFIEDKKWSLVPFEFVTDWVHRSYEESSFFAPYTNEKYLQVQRKDSTLLESTKAYYTIFVPITFAVFFLLNRLFYWLIKYKISHAIRIYSFWLQFTVIVVLSNSTKLSFLVFSHMQLVFTFDTFHRLSHSVSIVLSGIMIVILSSLFFVSFSLYGPFSKYFLINVYRVNYAYFLTFLRFSVRPLLEGAIHLFLFRSGRSQLIILALVEFIHLLLMCFMQLRFRIIKQKTTFICQSVIGFSILCMDVLLCLKHYYIEKDESQVSELIEDCLTSILYVAGSIVVAGIFHAFVAFIIDQVNVLFIKQFKQIKKVGINASYSKSRRLMSNNQPSKPKYQQKLGKYNRKKNLILIRKVSSKGIYFSIRAKKSRKCTADHLVSVFI